MLNDLYHMLDPVAISAGPITIYWYGLAYVVGALLTAVVMYRTQRRWGFNITIDDLTSVVVGVVFGLIIGARLFYVIFYGDGYYWAHPLEIFATNEGSISARMRSDRGWAALSAASSCAACISSTHGLWQTLPS